MERAFLRKSSFSTSLSPGIKQTSRGANEKEKKCVGEGATACLLYCRNIKSYPNCVGRNLMYVFMFTHIFSSVVYGSVFHETLLGSSRDRSAKANMSRDCMIFFWKKPLDLFLVD